MPSGKSPEAPPVTGDVVNLRQARKARTRAAAERAAAANRAAFGRSRADKTLAETMRHLADARLSGHRRGEPDET